MVKVVYYAGSGLNNGNSEWISQWINRNKSSSRYIGIGLVVALSVYILGPSVSSWIFGAKMFGSNSSSKRSDKHTTGLINNRNDCFANSSVQALSALPHLTRYINEVLKQAHLLRNIVEGSSSSEGDVNEDEMLLAQQHNQHLERIAEERPAMWRSRTSTNTISTLNMIEARTPNGGASETNSIEEGRDEEDSAEDEDEVSWRDIPKIPLHESLAQIMYQLQQTVAASHHISIWPFLRVIEGIFKAKISTGQNDAHELTQVVLQTLENENNGLQKFVKDNELDIEIPKMPVHGSLADHLVCLRCNESSKVNIHDFSMYSTPVPQTINALLTDIISDNQAERIEGYSCLCCKVKAILANEKNRNYAGVSKEEKAMLDQLEEQLPKFFINDELSKELTAYVNTYKKGDVDTSELKSTIVKKTVVVNSPDVLVIHLSRSVFNGMGYQKNTCNVLFDEELEVRTQVIEDNKCVRFKPEKYLLKAVVRHHGSHSAGHYECFRRKPEFVKDIDTNEIINKTPIVNFGIDSNKLAADMWNDAFSTSENLETVSIDSEDSNIPSHIPFRSVFPESANSAVVTEDDYVIGSTEFLDSNGDISRKSSTMKKFSGFLSRKGSISVTDNVSQSSSSSTISDGVRSPENSGRPRFNSISSTRRNRSTSVASANASIFTGSSIDQTTSATETESEYDRSGTDAVPIMKRKRRFKKLKSVVKYPWWRISDTVVKESKTSDVLSETKCAYMLYYEKL